MAAGLPKKGISLNPSYRPWRDPTRLNPDSWWDPINGSALVSREIPILRDLNVDILRLEFPWWGIERSEKGDLDWSRSDLIVASAEAAGIQIAPVIVFTPSWASAGRSDPATDCSSDSRATTCAAQVPSATHFADFVSAMVSRYRGRVGYWELWNEPDLRNYFAGKATDYAQRILAPGYEAVKRADPRAQVVFGGPSWANSRWIDAVLSGGGENHFDIMTFHDYRGVTSALKGARAVARRARGKPLWLSEFGREDQSRQAALIEGLLHTPSPLAACLWYELRDDEIFSTTGYCRTQTFGLLDHAYDPKPSLKAFRSSRS